MSASDKNASKNILILIFTLRPGQFAHLQYFPSTHSPAPANPHKSVHDWLSTHPAAETFVQENNSKL